MISASRFLLFAGLHRQKEASAVVRRRNANAVRPPRTVWHWLGSRVICEMETLASTKRTHRFPLKHNGELIWVLTRTGRASAVRRRKAVLALRIFEAFALRAHIKIRIGECESLHPPVTPTHTRTLNNDPTKRSHVHNCQQEDEVSPRRPRLRGRVRYCQPPVRGQYPEGAVFSILWVSPPYLTLGQYCSGCSLGVETAFGPSKTSETASSSVLGGPMRKTETLSLQHTVMHRRAVGLSSLKTE